MSEMSSAIRRATQRVVKLAEREGLYVVGFVVPKKDAGDDFGWSLFTNCEDEHRANDLTITIGDILREIQSTKTIN